MKTEDSKQSQGNGKAIPWQEFVKSERQRINNLRQELMKMVVVPGNLIQQAMDKQQMNDYRLSKIIQISRSEVKNLIAGKIAIHPDMAKVLENVLGIKAGLLMEAEEKYQKELIGIKELISQNKEEEKIRRAEMGIIIQVPEEMAKKRSEAFHKTLENKTKQTPVLEPNDQPVLEPDDQIEEPKEPTHSFSFDDLMRWEKHWLETHPLVTNS